jgi:predicted ATPase
MNIGICGAHRVGKTTLAGELAAQTGFVFLETSSGEVMRAHGFNPQLNYSFATRLNIQWLILNDAEQKYTAAEVHGDTFITDRTPIDFMAYLLADVQRANITASESLATAGYMRTCVDVVNRFFSMLVILQPGIPLIAAPNKAPLCPAYIEHLNALIIGLACSAESGARAMLMPRGMTDLHNRVYAVSNCASQYHAQNIESMSGQQVH